MRCTIALSPIEQQDNSRLRKAGGNPARSFPRLKQPPSFRSVRSLGRSFRCSDVAPMIYFVYIRICDITLYGESIDTHCIVGAHLRKLAH